jgi:hypothetical protein
MSQQDNSNGHIHNHKPVKVIQESIESNNKSSIDKTNVEYNNMFKRIIRLQKPNSIERQSRLHIVGRSPKQTIEKHDQSQQLTSHNIGDNAFSNTQPKVLTSIVTFNNLFTHLPSKHFLQNEKIRLSQDTSPHTEA